MRMVPLEKISTMDALWKKGFHLPSVCLLCNRNGESISHLLIHCPFSWEVWCELAKDIGTTFITPSDLLGLLGGWHSSTFNVFGKQVWRFVSIAICWTIWKDRNSRVFKGHVEPAWQVYRREKDLIVF